MTALAFRVLPDPVWRCAASALGAVTVASLLMWAAGTLGADASIVFAMAPVAAAVGAALGWYLQPNQQGVLAHDGRGWSWQAQRGSVRATIDLQGWMLLRFDAHHGPGDDPMEALRNQSRLGAHQWLPVARRMDPAQWHALRVAVQARTPDPAASRGA